MRQHRVEDVWGWSRAPTSLPPASSLLRLPSSWRFLATVPRGRPASRRALSTYRHHRLRLNFGCFFSTWLDRPETRIFDEEKNALRPRSIHHGGPDLDSPCLFHGAGLACGDASFSTTGPLHSLMYAGRSIVRLGQASRGCILLWSSNGPGCQNPPLPTPFPGSPWPYRVGLIHLAPRSFINHIGSSTAHHVFYPRCKADRRRAR